MIGRRAVLLAGTAAALPWAAPRSFAALPLPPGDRLAFRVIRHGSEIGRHTLTFEPQGDRLTVHVTVEAAVTMLSIPIVRYSHRATEVWDGGQLVALTGDTDKNGQPGWVRASRTAQGLAVQGSQTKPYVAPEPATPTSYWNKRMLDGPMISLEDGVLLRPKVAVTTGEAVTTASGGTIAADHYQLRGPFAVDVWYDHANTWAGLAFDVADGSSVRYERL